MNYLTNIVFIKFGASAHLMRISGKSSLNSLSIMLICFLIIPLFSNAGFKQKFSKSDLLISTVLFTCGNKSFK